MSHRLFGSAFCTWLLIICFLASCSAPPVNNSVKVLPADPNSAYDVNAAQNPNEASPKSSSITLLKDHKHQAISKTSAMEQYRKTHPEIKRSINFKKPGDFSIQAASNPGNCYVGPVATGTASGEIVGTVYRENDNGLYVYQGPSTYGPNLLDVGRLYYDGVTSTISFNWRYYTGGPAANVSATVSIPGRLEVGKTYSTNFISGAIYWPAGSSNLEEGIVTISVTEDKITATINAQSIYYRYQVYYYTPFFTNYGTANNVSGTADIYTAPCAPTIDLDASPTLVTSEETSEITVTPENNDFAWTLNITGPKEYSQSYPDVGLSEGEYSLAGTLPAGDYFLKAYYNAYPEYLALEKVRIQPDISLEIAPSYINPRNPDPEKNSAKITVIPSDKSLPWKMVITDPDGNSREEEPKTDTQTISLEGTDLIDGIYGIQVAYVDFDDVMASDQVTVESKDIEPTPTPTPTIGLPTPTPTPTPTAEPTVTPTPGPTVTPTPGPTPTTGPTPKPGNGNGNGNNGSNGDENGNKGGNGKGKGNCENCPPPPVPTPTPGGGNPCSSPEYLALIDKLKHSLTEKNITATINLCSNNDEQNSNNSFKTQSTQDNLEKKITKVIAEINALKPLPTDEFVPGGPLDKHKAMFVYTHIHNNPAGQKVAFQVVNALGGSIPIKNFGSEIVPPFYSVPAKKLIYTFEWNGFNNRSGMFSDGYYYGRNKVNATVIDTHEIKATCTDFFKTNSSPPTIADQDHIIRRHSTHWPTRSDSGPYNDLRSFISNYRNNPPNSQELLRVGLRDAQIGRALTPIEYFNYQIGKRNNPIVRPEGKADLFPESWTNPQILENVRSIGFLEHMIPTKNRLTRDVCIRNGNSYSIAGVRNGQRVLVNVRGHAIRNAYPPIRETGGLAALILDKAYSPAYYYLQPSVLRSLQIQ